MPYTKRIVVHSGETGMGLSVCLNYIENEEKTDHGILKSAYNCNLRFAEQEMVAIQSKFHNDQDGRVAYHVIQSFDIRDDITPEMANEIGLKLTVGKRMCLSLGMAGFKVQMMFLEP